MIERIPIRWRLTLGFTVAAALLIAVLAVVLRVTLAESLDDGVEQSLRARADEAGALVDAAGPGGLADAGPGRLSEADESFSQLLDRSGRVLGTSSTEVTGPLLNQAELIAVTGPTFLTIDGSDDPIDDRARLLAVARDDDTVLVVGTSLEGRDDTLARLAEILVIGGPIALILVAALGYALTGAALRPVAAMSTRAERISGSPDGARLPLAPARDEVRHLGATLNAMLDRVDGAMERERAFVADASHELRTPLAILKTEIELALTGDRGQSELRDALVSAGEETDRLARLAEDLLVLSRAERDGVPVTPESLGASGEIDRIVAPFRRAGRAITVEVDSGLRVWADPLRFRQAVGNLVDNAMRHGRGEVTVSADARGGKVVISVADEGPGIDPEFAPRAFERFSRADPGRAGGGAGLGLAIVAAIAAAHDGSVEIVRDDCSSAVALTLPAPPS